MVALRVHPDIWHQLIKSVPYPNDTPHATICYMPDAQEDQWEQIKAAVKSVTDKWNPIEIRVQKASSFPPREEGALVPHIALLDSPQLKRFRNVLLKELQKVQKNLVATNFDYVPHVTLQYAEQDAPLPEIDSTIEWEASEALLHFGDKHKTRFPFMRAHKQAGIADAALDIAGIVILTKTLIALNKIRLLKRETNNLWKELFIKELQGTTQGSLDKRRIWTTYHIEGRVRFKEAQTNKPIKIDLIGKYSKGKTFFTASIGEGRKAKVITEEKEREFKAKVSNYIREEIFQPVPKVGYRVVILDPPYLKGQLGTITDYWKPEERLRIQLDPKENEVPEPPRWFYRKQVKVVTMDKRAEIQKNLKSLSKQMDKLGFDNLAERTVTAAKGLSKGYKAKTPLEKVIGNMVREQSGIWLDEKQMKSIVDSLAKKKITEAPKSKEQWAAVGKEVGHLLDKLIKDNPDWEPGGEPG